MSSYNRRNAVYFFLEKNFSNKAYVYLRISLKILKKKKKHLFGVLVF